MNLREALDIKAREIISLVGGGGKTTIMFALARELASAGNYVITTTTTRINHPSLQESPRLVLYQGGKGTIGSIEDNLARFKHITIACEELDSGKLKGFSPVFIDELAGLNESAHIIVEADGAARRPLKAPNHHEPVIPGSTSLTLAVVGIEALGSRLDSRNVFRAVIASQLIGMELGEELNEESIAMLITHPHGLIKGSPEDARIAVFINKVGTEKDLAKARSLACSILRIRHPRIERVILSEARSTEPVKEIFMSHNS